ncbi:MAG: hypothetical protein KBA26_09400 [Candidatus Delongbacteria bacterium]|nr:hypothetical protein [Candidatus Delongbacteria bacterium]
MLDRKTMDRYSNRYGITTRGNKAAGLPDRNFPSNPQDSMRQVLSTFGLHGKMRRNLMMVLIIILLCPAGSIMAQSKKSKTRTSTSLPTAPVPVSDSSGKPSADPASRIAMAGLKGIYLNTGYEFLSPGHPGSDQAIAIRIERSLAGRNQWQEILRYDAPHDKPQLAARLEALGAESWLNRDSVVSRIWELIRQPRIDDLPFYFASLPVRRAAGTLALDSSVQPGVEYQYRLSRIGNGSGLKPPITTPKIVYPRKIECPAPVFFHRHANSGITVLSWIIPAVRKIDPADRPISFQVRRQDKMVDPFLPIHPKQSLYQSGDTLFFELHDSLGADDRIARYYIVPVDFYEAEGNPSDTVWGTVYNRLEIPAPSRIKCESLDSLGSIRLSWEIADLRFLKSIRIYRSSDFDTGYVHIAEISPKRNDYRDSQVEPMKIYYYKLCPVTLLDEELPPTAIVHGLAKYGAAPIEPRIIRAEGISHGVRLEIECPDPMLEGYRVYRGTGGDSLRLISDLIPIAKPDQSSDRSPEPSRKSDKTKSKTRPKSGGKSSQKSTPIPEKSNHNESEIQTPCVTVFIDSARELSGRINYAYAVRAENTSHIPGEFSDTVWVRPVIPTHPLPPSNVRIFAGDEHLLIHWDPMTEIDPDIAAYQVYRRPVSERSGTGQQKSGRQTVQKSSDDSTGYHLLTMEPLRCDQNLYRDSLVEKGTLYQYSVVSLDRFGGRSGFGTPVPGMIQTALPLPPDNLRLESVGEGISIRWDPVVLDQLESYRIYRYERGGKPTLMGSVSALNDTLYSGAFHYLDRSALRNHLYFYYLTTRDSLHRESGPSREVSFYR